MTSPPAWTPTPTASPGSPPRSGSSGRCCGTPATGLVEFPGPRAVSDGQTRDGFYSWRPGEEAVTHWRTAAADPADRAPVRPLARPAADSPAADASRRPDGAGRPLSRRIEAKAWTLPATCCCSRSPR